VTHSTSLHSWITRPRPFQIGHIVGGGEIALRAHVAKEAKREYEGGFPHFDYGNTSDE
jgi:hypothetical protein